MISKLLSRESRHASRIPRHRLFQPVFVTLRSTKPRRMSSFANVAAVPIANASGR
jgi:hypothetical protein